MQWVTVQFSADVMEVAPKVSSAESMDSFDVDIAVSR